jgi:hypothetical protein
MCLVPRKFTKYGQRDREKEKGRQSGEGIVGE